MPHTNNLLSVLFFSITYLLHLCNATGYLTFPVPRSFGDIANRAELINTPPCGGAAFEAEKQDPKTIPSSQHFVTGSAPTFTWKKIFLRATSSSFSYFLCIDTKSQGFKQCHTLASGISAAPSDVEAMVSNKIGIPEGMLPRAGDASPATLVWQWRISRFEYINNCADVYLKENANTPANTPLANYSALHLPFIASLPQLPPNAIAGACIVSSTNRQRTLAGWNVAKFGENCVAGLSTMCPPSMCCSSLDYCGPYHTSSGDYMAAGFGPIDYFRARTPYCNAKLTMDNRYVPNPDLPAPTQADLIDLCWKCTLPDPAKCTYQFYENVTTPTLPPSPGTGDSSSVPLSQNPLVILLAVLIGVFFCLFVVCLLRYRSAQMAKTMPKNVGLLMDESDDGVGDDEEFVRKKPQSILQKAASKLKPNPMPTGWQEYFTDDNEPYYYNEETGETQWELPTE